MRRRAPDLPFRCGESCAETPATRIQNKSSRGFGVVWPNTACTPGVAEGFHVPWGRWLESGGAVFGETTEPSAFSCTNLLPSHSRYLHRVWNGIWPQGTTEPDWPTSLLPLIRPSTAQLCAIGRWPISQRNAAQTRAIGMRWLCRDACLRAFSSPFFSNSAIQTEARKGIFWKI